MHFRIGVNLGDIIVREDGTIYGDGVNVAARLEGLAEPGGVMLSEDAYRQVEGKLDVALEDAGEHEVKNIAKPVGAYRVLLDGSEAASPGKPRLSTKSLSRSKLVAGLVAVLAVVVGVSVWQFMWETERNDTGVTIASEANNELPAIPTGPSIAVLPFTNMSGDQEQEYFADGIAEDILTSLSRQDELVVIARTSTFQYRDSDQDIREIAAELGAKYVLEGSVRRGPDAIRVTAQLIDGRDGSHLWADNYDSAPDALRMFEVQDEIVASITAVIGDAMGIVISSEVSEALRKAPSDLQSYDCVLLAYHHYRHPNPESHAAARDCLEKAVVKEPDYADAWALLGEMYMQELYGHNPRPDTDPLEDSHAAAQQALKLDPQNLRALVTVAYRHFWQQDAESYREAAQSVIDTSPNNSENLASIGMGAYFAGYHDWGLELARRARELTPNPPGWYYSVEFHTAYLSGDYKTAVDMARKHEAEGDFWSYHHLAIAHAQAGNVKDASEAAAELLRLNPEFGTRNGAKANLEWWEWGQPGAMAHWMEGLEKAGLFDAPESPIRPVIAVLPFDNMSDDSEQDFFADGIVEDIITRLAQLSEASVLGRNTTFAFKTASVDITEFAEEIGANYVVEGSVRRANQTVRVTAQLLDVSSGTHVWADVYDRPLEAVSVFAIQDEITEAVAGQIGGAYGAIMRAEIVARKRIPPKHMSSYDCTLMFWEYVLIAGPETHLAARDCLEKVVEDEPDYPEALAMLADTYVPEVMFDWNRRPETTLEMSLELANRASILAPENPFVRSRLMMAHLWNRNRDRALLIADEVTKMAPNNLDVLWYVGEVYDLTGQCDLSFEVWEKVVELNPYAPKIMHWRPARCHLARGEWEDALHWVVESNTDWNPWTYMFIAATYCHMGNTEEGKVALDKALEMQPQFVAPEVFWKDAHIFNQGGDSGKVIENWIKGLELCGFDVPPRLVDAY
jgi:adenylate cyclase